MATLAGTHPACGFTIPSEFLWAGDNVWILLPLDPEDSALLEEAPGSWKASMKIHGNVRFCCWNDTIY